MFSLKSFVKTRTRLGETRRARTLERTVGGYSRIQRINTDIFGGRIDGHSRGIGEGEGEGEGSDERRLFNRALMRNKVNISGALALENANVIMTLSAERARVVQARERKRGEGARAGSGERVADFAPGLYRVPFYR